MIHWTERTVLIIQVAIDDAEHRTLAMESLDSLTRVLGHCAIYESLYGQRGLDVSQSLNDSLVALYVLILGFLCYLNRYFGQNDAGKQVDSHRGRALAD